MTVTQSKFLGFVLHWISPGSVKFFSFFRSSFVFGIEIKNIPCSSENVNCVTMGQSVLISKGVASGTFDLTDREH